MVNLPPAGVWVVQKSSQIEFKRRRSVNNNMEATSGPDGSTEQGTADILAQPRSVTTVTTNFSLPSSQANANAQFNFRATAVDACDLARSDQRRNISLPSSYRTPPGFGLVIHHDQPSWCIVSGTRQVKRSHTDRLTQEEED